MPQAKMFSEEQNRELTRSTLLYSKAKMFCRECGTVKRLVDYSAGAKQPAKLECGHRRDMEGK